MSPDVGLRRFVRALQAGSSGLRRGDDYITQLRQLMRHNDLKRFNRLGKPLPVPANAD